MAVPLWVWITLGGIVIAGAGIAVYFLVLAPKPAPEIEFAALSVVNTNAHDVAQPGDRMQLSYRGSHAGDAMWLFSTDNGVSFAEIGRSSVGRLLVHTLPSDLFASKCLYRVGDPVRGDVYITSSVFAVQPVLSVRGVGMRASQLAVAGTALTFEVVTSDWHLLTLRERNFVMEYRRVGTDAWVQPADYAVNPSGGIITWQVGVDLLNASLYLRFRTRRLVSLGKPAELAYEMDYPITVVATATRFQALGGLFLSCVVFERFGVAASALAPLQWVDMLWTTSAPVERVNLAYANNAAPNDFTVFQAGVDASRGHYRFQVPAECGDFDDLLLRVSDQADPDSYATTRPLRIDHAWRIVDGGTTTLVCYPDEWNLVLNVEIHGPTAARLSPANWRTTLTFPKTTADPWVLSDVRGAALQIILIDPTADLYAFVYTVTATPPPLRTDDSVALRVALQYRDDKPTQESTLIQAFVPDAHGHITGRPFTDIRLVPNVNDDTVAPVAIPALLVAGATYYFKYNGSHIGLADGTDPGVRWQVQYDTLAADGTPTKTDMLLKQSITYGAVDTLGVAFPSTMSARACTVRVSLVNAVGAVVDFVSAPFEVVPDIGVAADQDAFFTGQATPVALVQTMDNQLVTNLLWHPSTAFAFEARASTKDPWASEQANVRVDATRFQFVWTPTAAGSFYFRFRTVNLGTLSLGAVRELSGESRVPLRVYASSNTASEYLQVDGLRSGTFFVGTTARLSRVPQSSAGGWVASTLIGAGEWTLASGAVSSTQSSTVSVPLPTVPTAKLYLAITNANTVLTAGPFVVAHGIIARIVGTPLVIRNGAGLTVPVRVWHTVGDGIPWHDAARWDWALTVGDAVARAGEPGNSHTVTATSFSDPRATPLTTYLDLTITLGTWSHGSDGMIPQCKFTMLDKTVLTTL